MHAYIIIAGVPGDAWVREGERCKRYAVVRASDSRPDTHSDRTHKRKDAVVHTEKKAGEKQPWHGYDDDLQRTVYDDWCHQLRAFSSQRGQSQAVTAAAPAAGLRHTHTRLHRSL